MVQSIKSKIDVTIILGKWSESINRLTNVVFLTLKLAVKAKQNFHVVQLLRLKPTQGYSFHATVTT